MIGAYIGLPTVIGDQIMQRVKFGAFLAPHHPIGENPMLQFRRDIDLVEQTDILQNGGQLLPGLQQLLVIQSQPSQ